MKKRKPRFPSKKIVHVLAQGTFDLLHPGHVYYLSHAKKYGTFLTVIVARNANVKRIKHKPPVLDEKIRLKMVASIKMVDNAVLGGKGNILDKVVEINPDVIVLGYDQQAAIPELREKLGKRGWFGKIVRAPALNGKKYKSSILKKQVVKNHQKTST